MGYIEDIRQLVGHRPIILVGSVTVIVDEQGRILLQQRKFPSGAWGLTGGLMELGESTEDTARREVYEETGLQVQDLHLLTVHSGPGSYIKAQNGDEFYSVTVAYYSSDYSGKLTVNPDESLNFQWFPSEDLPDHVIGSHRVIIEAYLAL